MLITVMYQDGRVGMVEHTQLDSLIKDKKITRFMRAEGWVCIRTDPIRKCENEDNFCGKQKRQGR